MVLSGSIIHYSSFAGTNIQQNVYMQKAADTFDAFPEKTDACIAKLGRSLFIINVQKQALQS